MKSFILCFALCIGCSAPTEQPQSDPKAIIACETTGHNVCAHCCEVQPYVESINPVKIDPITACSSSPLPANWSVDWCMQDCEAEVDNSCQPSVP